LAKKENKHEEEIDLTSFSWVNAGYNQKMEKPGCGGCHPGGGGMEFDREGNRYDVHLRDNPELAGKPDGDYFKSKWDKTGVIEADCLLCHQPGYFFKDRIKQLTSQNFKWAIVAGSGFGQVYGTVADGDAPKVVYNKRFFNDDGKIAITMKPSPDSENCLFCHGKADMLKRGFSWYDAKNHDVHNSENIQCATCHPADIQHQFSKGNENLSTVRDDLDNTMLTCNECHYSGYMGAPKPDHPDIRPNHLEKMSCEACHIPVLGRSSAQALDVSTGNVRLIPRAGAKKVGGELKWNPEMHLGEDGKLHPVSAFQPNLYTNKSASGLYFPLFSKEIAEAYERVKSELSLLSPGEPLVNTRAEIEVMLKALQQTLAGNPRFEQVSPYYHTGGLLFHLATDGKLVQEEDTSWPSEPNPFNINHNVAPTQLALGANGCGDCHGDKAVIFSSWIQGKAEPENGTLSSKVLSAVLSKDSRLSYLNHLHKYNSLKTYLIPLLVIVVFSFVLFREGRFVSLTNLDGTGERMGRVAVLAWLLFVRNITFLILIFTGLGFFFNKISLLELFFSSAHSAVGMHWGTGGVFLLSILGCIVSQRAKYPDNRTDICLLGIFGGKEMIITMGLSGAGLVFRENLPSDLIYICSLIHTVAAFVLIAVFAAKSYLVLSQRLSVITQE
jgi:nitrate/TMAO reductase-like tetraheme cytochrome c subunit